MVNHKVSLHSVLELSCYELRLHNDFAESFLTRGLSPLPVYVLDN